jgi:cytochrome c oxidase subunit 1
MSHAFPETAYLMIGLMALSGLAAVVGGGLFVAQVVVSVFFGRRLDPAKKSGKVVISEPVTPSMHGIGVGSVAVPGTMVLAFIFLVSFVLYYFVNWKYLSEIWVMR